MPTEQERKQTLSVLERMRAEGMPPAARAAQSGQPAQYQNEWTGEQLPQDEEERQRQFDADKARRTEQSQVNTMPEGAYKQVYGALQGVTGGVQPGPTGMSPIGTPNPGMTPYSPAENERRSGFIRTGVEALDQPVGKQRALRKKPVDDSDEPADKSAPVSGGY